ncbi:MAG: tyrosine-type recombinase/integrase [Vicinamibacterales bacterium]
MKTPAGWRDPSLNAACSDALRELWTKADAVGFADLEHYVFPWQGRNHQIAPERPMTAWRSAWRSIRKAAGLEHVRFHDGRHTALTRLAEKSQADWVIQAQMGHVSPSMMKTYSHVRRQALDQAAAALEPAFTLTFPEHEGLRSRKKDRDPAVTSQSTAQSPLAELESGDKSKEFGSSGWIRAESAERSEAVEA